MGDLALRDQPHTLRWDEIPAAETARHPGLISTIRRKAFDGVTITGLLSPAEVDRALAGLATTEDERWSFPNGSLLGWPLAKLDAGEDRTAYFDESDRARRRTTEVCGLDLHQRVVEVLAPLADGTPLVPPRDGDREYNPGQVRWWLPGMGGLGAHNGNEFLDLNRDGSFVQLDQITDVHDHLSYFFVLQRPEVGGELLVYHLLDDEHAHEVSWGNGERDDAGFAAIPHEVVDAAPGDLVLFGGGWRWHKVAPPEGALARISYGGFIAPARSGTELHLWC